MIGTGVEGISDFRRKEDSPVGQTSRQRRYSREDFARRGDEIYEREVLPRLSPADQGKYALIDIETGDYEIDVGDLQATKRVLAKRPAAVVYGLRIGHPAAYRLGGRFRVNAQ